MGEYVDLLASLPKTKRDVATRAALKTPEIVAVAKEYGRDYFDGDRKYGYGGYVYDGRWLSVVNAIDDRYDLSRAGMHVLDVGCAKGFLVSDLQDYMDRHYRVYGQAFGLDVSRYAVMEAPHPDAIGRLHLGNAVQLPFPDKSFDLVLSINTLHNLSLPECTFALTEIQRVGKRSFVQVDAYRTETERELFERWVLTADTYGTPEWWLELFSAAGYEGDYAWTIIEAEDG